MKDKGRQCSNCLFYPTVSSLFNFVAFQISILKIWDSLIKLYAT